MPHESGLIATITVALAFAFVGGFIATRLRLPAIVGYLLAGVAVGPFTPGFVADTHLAPQLAEIGVILLMFGVGIHFSLRDLLAVRGIAIPGAIGQSAIATLLAVGVAYLWGWNLGAGLVLGLAISVASTVVLLRALLQLNVLESTPGRVAVGWLIVEDLFTVLALVLLPALALQLAPGASAAAAAGANNILLDLLVALGKVVALAVLMLFVGARVVPWLLIQVSRTGSKELFTLSVLAVALGIAYGSAAIFGVSFALGAFLAGLVVGESDLSHQAAADALPLRDAFSVLFFVSVGMIFDPALLLSHPWHVLAVLLIILVAKPLTAFLIVAVLGHPARTGLIVAAGLAQIGEFSFILAELGRTLGMLPEEAYGLILAGALLSITMNPLVFRTVGPLERWFHRYPRVLDFLAIGQPGAALATAGPPAIERPRDHVVLCGYGRVGSLIGQELAEVGAPYVVIEQDERRVDALRQRGIAALHGDAADWTVVEQANLREARLLIVAIPDPLATRHIVEDARRVNPDLEIIVRAHHESELAYLGDDPETDVILAEREVASAMIRATRLRLDYALA